MIGPSQTRTKPKAMLSNFDMMIRGGPPSNNRDEANRDTPSCIDMITLEECSMFVNSMTKIDNIHEESKVNHPLKQRPESFLVNGLPAFRDAGKTPSILIVDDNTFNVYSLKLMIEETFHLQCDAAFSAKEAIQMISDRISQGLGVHRLILTDINMPEIDGMQMSKMIKRMLNKKKISQDNNNQILNSTLVDNFPEQNYETRIFAITAMNEE